MTRSEFIDKILHGDDIMFTVEGRGFTIITWPDDGIVIGEWDKEASEKKYASAESLVDEYSIDDKALADLVSKIKITSYTQVS